MVFCFSYGEQVTTAAGLTVSAMSLEVQIDLVYTTLDLPVQTRDS